jgi:hypothetical protein
VDQAEASAHWDAAYAHGDDTLSWFEEHPDMSLRMLDSAAVSPAAAPIDVGGGASPLTGALLDRGFRDLTVLDISATGTQYARARLGPRADQVHCLTADVLSWHPERSYLAWHDRAVFHFLTSDGHRRQYLHTLDTATALGAIAVFGCFAPDGPEHCSGRLPERRTLPGRRRLLPRPQGLGSDTADMSRPAHRPVRRLSARAAARTMPSGGPRSGRIRAMPAFQRAADHGREVPPLRSLA